MHASSPDERATFLQHTNTITHGGGIASPPPFSLDDDPDPDAAFDGRDNNAGQEQGLLSKPESQASRRTNRSRFCRLSRRGPKRRLFRLILKCTLSIVLSLLVFTPFLAPSYLDPPAHYKRLEQRCAAAYNGPEESINRIHGCANIREERIFISVSLYDKDGHLAAGEWGESLIKLVRILGPHLVHVSIYENDSGRRAASALERLRKLLPCHSTVVYDEHVSLDEFANVTMPDGSVRTKRLAYLSEIRNRALRPLDTLEGVEGNFFSRVLFLNDVAFRPIDAAHLLFNTNVNENDQAQYLSACALDYKNPLLFYDLYAQRDAEGFSNGIPIFPIFSTAGKAESRADMLAQRDAVRVQSCWGGMVAMRASYLQRNSQSLAHPDVQVPGSHVINPVNPTAVQVPADVSRIARIFGAPPSDLGINVNPYVRVAYDSTTLSRLRIVQRWERLFALPQAIISSFSGLPTHNPHRLVREGDKFVEEARTGRNGLFCGVREMQLLNPAPREGDKKWENVAIPPGQALDFPS
ncbi:hypothetical protein Sste5346_007919 [Sporothrix stenoceras]|uniref:Glycosyltransferase family 69 protein n=1 Tax=Sporothrix stenoceras TaxID=5173 RepID=A0ABR3YS34_9PEZI